MKLSHSLLQLESLLKYYRAGKRLLNDPYYKDAQEKSHLEALKRPLRTDIINFLLSTRKGAVRYLEIGVRDPDDNFNHIVANEKVSVDPGLENVENPVDFKLTSDEFFEFLSANKILRQDIRFDVIFIDGLHLANQVDRDITNSFKYLKDDGFIVLHDCNPPTEWHARENYKFRSTPAGGRWNGTTWKAFLKWRCNPEVYSCCIDSDWGVGVLSRESPIGPHLENVTPFFEFSEFSEKKVAYLNLVNFDEFKKFFS